MLAGIITKGFRSTINNLFGQSKGYRVIGQEGLRDFNPGSKTLQQLEKDVFIPNAVKEAIEAPHIVEKPVTELVQTAQEISPSKLNDVIISKIEKEVIEAPHVVEKPVAELVQTQQVISPSKLNDVIIPKIEKEAIEAPHIVEKPVAELVQTPQEIPSSKLNDVASLPENKILPEADLANEAGAVADFLKDDFNALSVLLPNFGEVVPGKVYRSACIKRAALPILEKLGFNIVDLRSVEEIPSDSYVHVIDKFTIERKTIDMLKASLKEKIDFLSGLLNDIKTKSQPILIHCSKGEDRTGGLASYIDSVMNGKTIEEACAKSIQKHGGKEGGILLSATLYKRMSEMQKSVV